ncbi:MAG: hypothetical protein OD816_001353 [Thermodesulfobacterium sp.]|uniref:Fibronectin type-III domain-containing protein n=1 Tax=Candidatus Thermodesulfobacterium syntrophicum TaxID=3060442 RepID=A0AAE3P5U7_9BACT|nr:hypothetical protein [Candidatus Thermodesulfobacterium syntrophicum]
MKKIKKFLFLFGLGFLILSCGKKTEPFPIEESIPKGLSFEIKLNTQGAEILVYLPIKTQGGYSLNKIKKLIIEKIEVPLDIPKAKKKRKVIKISPKLHSAGNLFIYNDYNLKHRHQYTYRVKVVKDFLVETPFTEPITIFWHNPPGLPQSFQLRLFGEDAVLITWKKPEKDIYGLFLEGEAFYEIEKRSEEKINFIKVRGKEEYFDELKPGEKVCYSIRAVLDFRGTLIPGPKTPYKCVK